MALTNSLSYRENLLKSLNDDGLEELIFRLVKPDYPGAQRVRRGEDGGVDVLSDLKTSPARAWQAKNYDKVPWGKCRASLKKAMEDSKPRHYTFVFPFTLTKNQRNFWPADFGRGKRSRATSN